MNSSQSQPPNNPPKKSVEKKAVIDALWRKGVVQWKLDKNQIEMRDTVLNSQDKIIVIAASRQLGKSYFLFALCMELCLQNKDYVIKYVAPKIKDIKNVVLTNFKQICVDCPKDLLPKYNKQEGTFTFKNGSMIQLAAAENGHIDGIRGTKADLCIVDEAGFCSDLDYAINSVLLPTTTTTGGKLIITSTPARSPDHDFVRIMTQAEEEGRLIRKTIYDNPRLSEKEIEEFAKACGGKHTVQFRREYLAENIISEDDAVIPEFNQELQDKIVKEWARPTHFDAYNGMDIGGKDFTAVLFAYYDFREAKIIIEDELVFKGKEIITDNIASSIKRKDEELYRNPMTGEVKAPYLRIADNNNLILLNDLAVKHGINFIPTAKDNKDAAINNVRLLLKDERIIINPKCKTLILHLRSAVWAKNRKEFTRSSDKGHFDLVDALIYLCRNIQFHKNPYPTGYSGKDMFIVEQPKATTQFEKSMESAFKVTKVGSRRRF